MNWDIYSFIEPSNGRNVSWEEASLIKFLQIYDAADFNPEAVGRSKRIVSM